jgi:ABC-2 type transport system ATP-binding protein
MDEAERCHRLAILARGRKVADGSPQQLKDAIAMAVVEVETRDTASAEGVLTSMSEVSSVTQLGIRLRLLLPDGVDEPATRVGEALRNASIEADVRQVEPSLEDVFIAVTLTERSE